MPIDRRKAADVGFPVGALLVAWFATLAQPLEHSTMPFRMLLVALAIALLFATVFVVLRHAEAVAHHLGEPYGTLVLTLSVTTIEASVIVSMMLHGENNPTLARESIFSTVMIVTTGVLGVCLTFGGWRHRHQDIKRQGTSAFLAMLVAMTGFTLVLPNYTLAGEPGSFSTAQMIFVSLLSLLPYGSFVLAQMNSHRDDFVEDRDEQIEGAVQLGHHRSVAVSLLLLFVGLAGIVLLAEQAAIGLEDGLHGLEVGHTDAIIGAFIATLVLMPESASAIKAAWGNELQRPSARLYRRRRD